MTNDRRYDEDEVRRIFEAATNSSDDGGDPGRSGDSRGMTLGEIQAIGREVGVHPDRIAQAASELDVRAEPAARRTWLGMPVGVGRTVPLERAPNDREWELLVADLRSTFGARGHAETIGTSRAWTNGNLHVYVEPTGTGHRLRMGTVKGSALSVARLGVAALALSLVLLVVGLFTAGGSETIEMAALFALGGGGALAAAVAQTRPWAGTREQQFDRFAARTRGLLAADEGEASG